ncbi:hypothetical protein [Nonomuraea sp. NPDC049158]
MSGVLGARTFGEAEPFVADLPGSRPTARSAPAPLLALAVVTTSADL